MFVIKKVSYKKVGSKWATEKVDYEKFNSFRAAKRYYSNVISDNGGKTRTCYSYSRFGVVSSKSFYSPSGLLKTEYKF